MADPTTLYGNSNAVKETSANASKLPAVTKSPEIQNKTDKPSNNQTTNESKYDKESQQIVENTGEKNVLNNYRSITYNFTLAAMPKSLLKDPQKIREKPLELVILQSGGKGTQGVSGNDFSIASLSQIVPQSVQQGGRGAGYNDPRIIGKSEEEKNKPMPNYGTAFLEDFNAKSPGRFDFYMENIEIDSIMSFSKDANLSMPTKMRFDIVEPYSMNGLIEALYVTSIAAGYQNYLHASFVLKVEFWGYPQEGDFPSPVKIPNSERFFPIGLTNIEVDVTEKGTRYKIEAVPYNERSFGQPNTVKKPIKMQGSNVKQILENFMKSLNEQTVAEFKEAHPEGNVNQVDTYEIKFPSWSEETGWVNSPENAIATKKLVELMKDNALYGLVDPASKDKPNAYKANGSKQPSAQDQAKKPESIKYNPNSTVVQFAEGMNAHDVISAVCRDSEYVRDILKDIKKHIDPYGMVDYFMIRIETTNTDVDNPDTKKPAQKITYIVSPFKIHYSKIPNLADNLINEKELKKLSRREYNYIYTGQNIDVINFKLNFNNLFFEAVPAAMGNKDTPGAKTAAGNNNNVKTGSQSPAPETASRMQVPMHSKKVITTQVQNYGGNASQPLDDPYSLLARNMHNAVVNSKASLVTGEIEILGDPFYLVEGGIGNYNPKPVAQGIVKGGQAAHTQQQTMVTINFRNPIDIDPQTGMMFFDGNRVPFSGVYMITEVHHTFKDGVFKQRLEIVRVPGQILDYNVKATDPSQSIITRPDPQSAVKVDNTRAISYEQRADSNTVATELARGTPTPDSNFTGATGGLGGTDLARNFGVVGRNGGLFNGASVIGSPLPKDLTSNIRLNASGLANLGKTNLSTIALAAVATNVLTGNIPAKRAVGLVAGTIAGSAIASAIKTPVKGSGIGEGATVFVSGPTSLPLGSVSDISSTLKDYGSRAVDTVTGMGKDIGNLIGGVGDKIKSLTSLPADPSAIAASVGLNASALSGLSTNLTSKIPNQIKDLVSKAPTDTNLSQAVASGVVLDYIPAGKIANLPATAPYSTAPAAAVDTSYVQSVVAKGGTRALENLYGVDNVSKLSANLVPPDLLNTALSMAPKGLANPLAGLAGQLNSVDANALKDKLLTAKSQINNLTGQATTFVASNFNSISAGTSPLNKLLNRNNDSA